MYDLTEDQELYPDNYVLVKIAPNLTEDECYDLLSKPRQTQTTIGLYLKKKKVVSDAKKDGTQKLQDPEQSSGYRCRRDPNHSQPYLEKLLLENKGFWVDKATVTAPLINKLKELYSVELPRKDPRKSQGIFYRPQYLELEHFIKLGKAGLLYPEEELTDSEEEVKLDETMCLPLRKTKYKICDPCKPETETQVKGGGQSSGVDQPMLPFKKIPTGCQCNYYGEHDNPPTLWDRPFQNEVDMIRKHEMSKYLRPYKSELLNKNYIKHPPVVFTPVEPEAKRTFPNLILSNL